MSCLVRNFRQRKALNPHIWEPANVQQGSMNFTYALWIWQEPGICWIQNIINIILRHGSAADPVSHPSMTIRKPFHGEFELLPSERHYRIPLAKKKIYKCLFFLPKYNQCHEIVGCTPHVWMHRLIFVLLMWCFFFILLTSLRLCFSRWDQRQFSSLSWTMKFILIYMQQISTMISKSDTISLRFGCFLLENN